MYILTTNVLRWVAGRAVKTYTVQLIRPNSQTSANYNGLRQNIMCRRNTTIVGCLICRVFWGKTLRMLSCVASKVPVVIGKDRKRRN